MTSVADLLRTAKLPTRKVPVCLRGDLVAELEDLQRQLADAEKGDGVQDERLGAPAPGADIREQIENVRAEMRDSITKFEIRALNPDEMDALIAEHPATTPEDKEVGYDFSAVRQAVLRVALVDPVIHSDAHDPEVKQAEEDEQWKQLRSVVSHGQWGELVGEAYQLAASKVDTNFLLRP